MEERLEKIFSNVNEWLRFAETKNASIVGANAVAIFGIAKLFTDNAHLNQWLKGYLILLIVCAVIGGILALCSFLPRINIPWLESGEKEQPHHNLIFYSDIAKYEPKQYLSSLYKLHGTTVEEFSKLENDYAEQIVVNSRITLKKYEFFRTALWITIAGIVTPVLAIIIYIYFIDK